MDAYLRRQRKTRAFTRKEQELLKPKVINAKSSPKAVQTRLDGFVVKSKESVSSEPSSEVLDTSEWSLLRALELVLCGRVDRPEHLVRFRAAFAESADAADVIAKMETQHGQLIARLRRQLSVRRQLCHRPVVCSDCRVASQLSGSCSSCGAFLDPAIGRKADTVEPASIRGLDALHKLLKAKKNVKAFDAHGGDALFLFRYVVTGTPPGSDVNKRARDVVMDVLSYWDRRHSSLDPSTCSPEHMLVFAEATHAKLHLLEEGPDRERLQELKDAMGEFDLGKVISFSPSKLGTGRPPYLHQGDCSHCGRRNSPDSQQCSRCRRDLRESVIDYQSICFAVVWCGLFAELGQASMDAADSSCSVEDVLALVPHLRPYGSVDNIGEQAFKAQGYFVTHLLYVMSNWGEFRLDADVFAEELIFLCTNLDTVVRLGDPELVGEFVQCLRILGLNDDTYIVRRGVAYLLSRERSLKCKGVWVKSTRNFFQTYHAIYCALIGMLPLQINQNSKLLPEWRKFFV